MFLFWKHALIMKEWKLRPNTVDELLSKSKSAEIVSTVSSITSLILLVTFIIIIIIITINYY